MSSVEEIRVYLLEARACLHDAVPIAGAAEQAGRDIADKLGVVLFGSENQLAEEIVARADKLHELAGRLATQLAAAGAEIEDFNKLLG